MIAKYPSNRNVRDRPPILLYLSFFLEQDSFSCGFSSPKDRSPRRTVGATFLGGENSATVLLGKFFWATTAKTLTSGKGKVSFLGRID